MRHKKKRATQLAPGPQKRSLMIRNLITSLVTHGAITTTAKRAKALKAEADMFFSRLVSCYASYSPEAARREIIRRVGNVIMTPDASKKLVDELVPQRNESERSFGYIQTLKLGTRLGDNAEKVLVRIQ